MRVAWAEANADRGAKWGEVIFSDEKKLNLDGPDGFKYYWRDLRKEPEIFSHREQGGDSVMVWDAFSAKGQSLIPWLEGRLKSSDYVAMLSEYLLPFSRTAHADNFIFQQDGTSSHRSHQTKKWVDDQNIEFLDWPAKSPDLNPIENVWGKLARTVYENGK